MTGIDAGPCGSNIVNVINIHIPERSTPMIPAYEPRSYPPAQGVVQSARQLLLQARDWLDARGRVAWLAAMVLGLVFAWPVGLAILGYMIWSKRMFGTCTRRSRHVPAYRAESTGNAIPRHTAPARANRMPLSTNESRAHGLFTSARFNSPARRTRRSRPAVQRSGEPPPADRGLEQIAPEWIREAIHSGA